jgi:hypothetical protein
MMLRQAILVAGGIFWAHASVAQELDCKQIEGNPVSGKGNDTPLSIAALNDHDYKSGYRVTGGGCVQMPSGGEHYVRIATSLPTPHDFTCKFMGDDPEGMRGKAYAIACRVGPSGPRPLGQVARYSSAGLGGGIVTIARIGGDAPTYTAVIPFSLRICNLEGATSIGIYYGAGSDNVTNYKIVPFGKCLEVDKPRELMFHTPDTVSIDVAGKYQLFKAGTFSGATVVVKPTDVREDKAAKLGPPSVETVQCYQGGDPKAPPFPIPGGKLNSSYWGWCKPPSLTGGKNFRICFDNGYTNQPVGASDYPGAFVPMVLDAKLMTVPEGATPDEFIYNSGAPDGCRDLFKVDQAYFIVTNNTWNSQSVANITYRFQEILP